LIQVTFRRFFFYAGSAIVPAASVSARPPGGTLPKPAVQDGFRAGTNRAKADVF